MGYRLPPEDIVRIVDAPPTPAAIPSPDGSALLFVSHDAHPPIELLSRPFLRLGGIRVDPMLGARQRATVLREMRVVRVADGAVVALDAPERFGVPVWSYDRSAIAFARDVADGLEVWVADPSNGAVRRLDGLRANDVLAGAARIAALAGMPGAPMAWEPDNRHLLVRAVPDGRGPAPERSHVPRGPRIEETSGKRTQMATFQDLLASPEDEDAFAFFASTQLVRVDTQTGALQRVGEPGMIASVDASPDGRFLLVTRLRRPFSYRVPHQYFSRIVEVWDADGSPVRTIADLPVSDEVPRQGVPTGPRAVRWQESRDARLLWAEALDGGDPTAHVEHRDRLMTLDAPFDGEPHEAMRVRHRFVGVQWTQEPDRVLLTEHDRDRRWRTTSLVDLASPEDRRILFDLSQHDAYNDPGQPLRRTTPDGRHLVFEQDGRVLLSGRGASPDGDRPFLDRYDLRTGEAERLFQCAADGLESFVCMPDDDPDTIVIRRESPAEPPNYHAVSLSTGERRSLTSFEDPHPQVTGVTRRLVRYERADGVGLSGTLYLPPGYDPASRKRLPTVIWAYPREFSDPQTAGQVRGSDRAFTRLAATSPLWFLLRGWAVLMDATMPVVGDSETMNDTYVEQVVAAAQAAVNALDEMGVADRDRLVVSGHSYGGFMTANLLAHTDLFRAGIARSGAHNRTLTPFGFQTERRSYWEVPEIYHRVSPFRYADRITAPILLIHGMQDNNSGTFPIQSERLFQAIQGLGGTARLVMLPAESHGYRARESVLHVIAEMLEWAERHAGVDCSRDEHAGTVTSTRG